MNLHKILSYIFGFFTIGAISETYRILTSPAPDIAPQRGYLAVMVLVMAGIFIYLTLTFWKKGKG